MKTLKKRVYIGLEEQQGGWLAKSINTILMVLILLNILVVIFQSEPVIGTSYRDWFLSFEVFSVIIFTIEYLLRIWASPAASRSYCNSVMIIRARFVCTPMAIIDLIAILPFYLWPLGAGDFLILRTLRLIRGLKLIRYSRSMELLILVIRQEAMTILSACFLLGIIIILAATGMYLVERDIQPEVLGSIPRSFWWAAVTLTTVGYGDVIPLSIEGKILGVIITIAGIGMAALPAGILASGFTSEVSRRREIYITTKATIICPYCKKTIN